MKRLLQKLLFWVRFDSVVISRKCQPLITSSKYFFEPLWTWLEFQLGESRDIIFPHYQHEKGMDIIGGYNYPHYSWYQQDCIIKCLFSPTIENISSSSLTATDCHGTITDGSTPAEALLCQNMGLLSARQTPIGCTVDPRLFCLYFLSRLWHINCTYKHKPRPRAHCGFMGVHQSQMLDPCSDGLW